MTHLNKILVIAPSWVGDLVMSQALLRLLKKQDPDGVIDVFANATLHPLLKRMPEVANCLTSPFKSGELRVATRFAIAKKLQNNSYTRAYVLPNTFKSALIPFLAKIPVRTGWCGEERYFLLNDMRFFQKKIPLMVECYIALGCKKDERVQKPYLLPELQVSPEQIDSALKRLQLTITKRPILAICPGAEYGPSKRWPASYFAAVGMAKINQGWEVWIFGGIKEQICAQEIQEICHNRCVDLTGKTDLGEAVDLISLATAVVANDSGLMHVAAALGKPLVAIYGSTPPGFAPPLSNNKFRTLFLNLPCSPCGKKVCPLNHTKCLYDLKPDLVLRSIADIV